MTRGHLLSDIVSRDDARSVFGCSSLLVSESKNPRSLPIATHFSTNRVEVCV